jgi:two-component system response regulator HydG
MRALQQKEIFPLGSAQGVPIMARVLAGTNRDLSGMVEQGRFRRDLYFRLNVVSLRIPPLRDHKEDIPMLVAHFLERNQKETGVTHTFSDEVLRIFQDYDWPGNVREFEAAIERACALSSGPVLHVGDLPPQLQEFRLQAVRNRGAKPGLPALTHSPPHDKARLLGEDSFSSTYDLGHESQGEPAAIVSIAELEKKAILGTIRQLSGDKLMAARLLGIGKTTLYRKLKEYGITEY